MRNEVAQLTTALDAVLGADMSGAEDADLLVAIQTLEQASRRLESARYRVVAQLESRRLAVAAGSTSTADLLVRLLRVTPSDARARLARAAELTPRATLAGEILPPLFPAVAAACERGLIGSEHVAVISRTMDSVPSSLDTTAVTVVEEFLVEAAEHEHPAALARTAAVLLARLEPDEPPEPDATRRDRALRLRRLGDGTSRISGLLNVEATTAWSAVLDAVSAPRPAADGVPDPRTADQRRHDGAVEVMRRALLAGALPPTGGTPVTIVVRTTAADLGLGAADSSPTAADSTPGAAERPVRRRGVAFTDRGEPWLIADLRAAASPARIVEVRTDADGAVLALGDGAPLWLGRSRRLASKAQRLALALRDGGCSFPGCAVPAAWTEAHHVVEWALGGPTDIDNLTLLCRHHHRVHAACGWQVVMRRGLPWWIPPARFDVTPEPLRNTVHQPPELDWSARATAGPGGSTGRSRSAPAVTRAPP